MQKPIRTLIALLAVAAVVLSFAACGSKTSGSDATDPTATAESVSASDTSAAPGTTAAATPADTARAALSAAKEQTDAAGNSAAEDGQNPVMNYVGDYECDRCSITIEADGDTDAKITVHWGSSATEATVWTMSGRFDPDTKRINYSDSTKTVMNFEGEEEKDTVVYENGVGRIQFLDDGKLEWQDEQEIDTVRGMVFESIG